MVGFLIIYGFGSFLRSPRLRGDLAFKSLGADMSPVPLWPAPWEA